MTERVSLRQCDGITWWLVWPSERVDKWPGDPHIVSAIECQQVILARWRTLFSRCIQLKQKMKPEFKNCMFDNSETATCSLEDDDYQLPVSGTSGRSPHRWMSIAHRSYSPIILTHLTRPCKPSSIIFPVNQNTLAMIALFIGTLATTHILWWFGPIAIQEQKFCTESKYADRCC